MEQIYMLGYEGQNLSENCVNLIRRLIAFDQAYSGCLQPEMLDWLQVVANGAQKYAPNGWLDPDGQRTSRKDMHDSITHHRAESFVFGPNARDKESGLHPNLHEACRSIMQYIRDRRGIQNSSDPDYGRIIIEELVKEAQLKDMGYD